MDLEEKLIERAEKLGINIKDHCESLKDLVSLLPEGYLFIEQKLWCGDIGIDADNYDYGNATLEMLIRLKYERERGILLELQGINTRWFTQEEFDRLKELTNIINR